MYGMLLESVQHYIKQEHGQYIWDAILEHAGIRNIIFTTHKVYNDDVMVNIARGCSSVLGDKTVEEYMSYFGECFVEFFSHYGYDKILRVSGRHYRDFLNGIDNLHEMMRFSYPHLQSPSFYVESEDQEGCVLVYRSKRQGFKHYVIGQLKQCASLFYDVYVDISILTEYDLDEGYCTKYRLDFQNDAYTVSNEASTSTCPSEFADISASTFFKVFPFCILFDQDFVIRYTGSKLSMLLDNDTLIGSYMPSKFVLRRPLVDFNWENVQLLEKVMFELQYIKRVRHSSFMTSFLCTELLDKVQNSHRSDKELGVGHSVLFRGQMKMMTDWNVMAFLCTPLVGNLDDMRDFNLYINDLNMYDNSRDMVMAGWQHASQLECSIEQQIKKGQKITKIMKSLDEWQMRSNNLLYSMIPKAIAERLKKGDDPINTCEIFDEVTILFSYLVGFTDICAQARPMQIVQCITDVVNSFDSIVDKYDCFKVETLGDAVYMIAGGVPDQRPNHAKRVAGLALEMISKAQVLKDPVSQKNLQLRIGMHTGSVVGGVVGRRMPQYCLFGDTVNTASRMQSNSEPGRIHLSESCHKCLVGQGFITVFRGKVNVKGKGEMKTYWLCGKEGQSQAEMISKQYRAERLLKGKRRIYRSFENGFDLHGMHTTTSAANFTTYFDVPDNTNETGNNDLQKLSRSQSMSALTASSANKLSTQLEQLKSRKISDSVTTRSKKQCPMLSNSNEFISNSPHYFCLSQEDILHIPENKLKSEDLPQETSSFKRSKSSLPTDDKDRSLILQGKYCKNNHSQRQFFTGKTNAGHREECCEDNQSHTLLYNIDDHNTISAENKAVSFVSEINKPSCSRSDCQNSDAVVGEVLCSNGRGDNCSYGSETVKSNTCCFSQCDNIASLQKMKLGLSGTPSASSQTDDHTSESKLTSLNQNGNTCNMDTEDIIRVFPASSVPTIELHDTIDISKLYLYNIPSASHTLNDNHIEKQTPHLLQDFSSYLGDVIIAEQKISDGKEVSNYRSCGREIIQTEKES